MGGTNDDWLWSRLRALPTGGQGEPKALDFGCGSGRLITRSLDEKYADVVGVDTFYGDEEIAPEHVDTGAIPEPTRARISRIEPGGPLPFDDETFDFVCSNQVFEHVAALDKVIDELARVTKPGGIQLHAFPTKERVVEGHAYIPLLHRVPLRRRERWARLFYRRARFADQTDSFEEWWGKLGPFLAENTFYRARRQYDEAFARRFKVRHVEDEKLAFHLTHSRLRPLAGLARAVPTRIELMRVGVAVELTR